MLGPRTGNVGFLVDFMLLWLASLWVLLCTQDTISHAVLRTQTLYYSSKWQLCLKKLLWWFHCNATSDSERRKEFRIPSSYISIHFPLFLNTIFVGLVWWNNTCYITRGHAVTGLVEALRYKPEGRVFDSRLRIGIFHLHNPFGRTKVLGLTQPPT